jgi:integrase/recombinase XerD
MSRTWTSSGGIGPSRLCARGGKRVAITLAPRTSRAPDLYLGERTTGPIFLGAKGGRMDRHAADRTVKRLARRAGIAKRISPHSIRHSFITADQLTEHCCVGCIIGAG